MNLNGFTGFFVAVGMALASFHGWSALIREGSGPACQRAGRPL